MNSVKVHGDSFYGLSDLPGDKAGGRGLVRPGGFLSMRRHISKGQ